MINNKISIIVPVNNDEKYLRNCIDSICNQTIREIEIILIDNGSTDKSGSICDEYADKYSNIRVIHTKDTGVSLARNIGIEMARGEYIGFVDGDDYIDKDMYKHLYQLCIDNKCDISICKLGREIDGKLINGGEDEFVKILNNEDAMEELFKGILYRFSLCNKLFHRDCFKEIYFPEGRIHEDLSTTYKLLAKADKIIYTNYIGYIYVKRNNSILTKKYNEKRLDAFIGWDEIIEFIKNKYPNLIGKVSLCFSYMCIDHIYYILNQLDDKKYKNNLLKKLQLVIKKHYKLIIFNKEVGMKNKLILSILNLNTNLLIGIFYLKSKIIKGDNYYE